MSGPESERPASEPDPPAAGPGASLAAPPPAGDDARPPLAARVREHLQLGGVLTPVITTLIAFVIGGLVVAASGKNPLDAYQGIYNGSGLSWLLPWTGNRDLTAINLQLTLLRATPLILVGLAVAYAFRAGLFNIGGQGQYTVGTIAAVSAGAGLGGLPGWLHIIVAIVVAALAGAIWGGIAGFLRATVGANEVISTIMLNYIALWVGVYLFGLGGPLQDPGQPDVPSSRVIHTAAKLPVFWGNKDLQGLHIGFFIALAAGLVFWIILNRSVKGYEARAVGLSPAAAAYSGINVGRTYIGVMATCGAFAGIAGSLDVLGYQFSLVTNDIQLFQIGFLGIAVALLGRNTAGGTVIAAVLFGALLQGTSVRNLDASLDPNLAGNLTTIIQGLVVLFVAADVLVIFLFRRAKARRRAAPAMTAAPGAVA